MTNLIRVECGPGRPVTKEEDSSACRGQLGHGLELVLKSPGSKSPESDAGKIPPANIPPNNLEEEAG